MSYCIVSDEGRLIASFSNAQEALEGKRRLGGEIVELPELPKGWAKLGALETKRSTVVCLDAPDWAKPAESIACFIELLEDCYPLINVHQLDPQRLLLRWADSRDNHKVRLTVSEIKYKAAWCIRKTDGRPAKWEMPEY